MTAIAIVLLVIGAIVCLICGIWTVVLAFQRSAWWGLAVLLLGPAVIAFLIVAWDEAKKPFLIWLAGFAICIGGTFALPTENVPGLTHHGPGGSSFLHAIIAAIKARSAGQPVKALPGTTLVASPSGNSSALAAVVADARTPQIPALPTTAATPAVSVIGSNTAPAVAPAPLSRAELEARLAALKQKEATLVQRKFALKPGDKAAAAALAREIMAYNAELTPLLQQLQARPKEASQRNKN